MSFAHAPAAPPASPPTSTAARPTARAIRVCIVAPSLAILGGQAVQAARLLERLRELPGLDVSFLPVNPRLPGPLRLLQRVKYVRTVVTSAAYAWALLTRVRDCDVVHAFSASYWSFLLAPVPAMAAARLYGRRVVLNYHSGEAEDHLRRSRVAVRAMRVLADAIVVPSAYLVDVFARFGLRARAVFNFVELEQIPYRRRTALAGNASPLFFSNRNLEPMYNAACTLRAFARVQAALPGARLMVAGDGSERARLEALAASLGLRHVEFVGRVAPEAMLRLYDAADVFVNASDIDNMPLSVIEAYAAGLPVVTTDAGGIPYIVRDGDTGLLVQRGDDSALAAAALRLLREPGLGERLADRARAECVGNYAWSAVRAQWADLYASLVAAPGAAAEEDASSHLAGGGSGGARPLSHAG